MNGQCFLKESNKEIALANNVIYFGALKYAVASRSALFTPSQEAYHRLEASPAFSPLTRARGFVSVHQDRAFLPIFRRSIITEDDDGSPSSDQEFPGQGRRLGGTT